MRLLPVLVIVLLLAAPVLAQYPALDKEWAPQEVLSAYQSNPQSVIDIAKQATTKVLSALPPEIQRVILDTLLSNILTPGGIPATGELKVWRDYLQGVPISDKTLNENIRKDLKDYFDGATPDTFNKEGIGSVAKVFYELKGNIRGQGAVNYINYMRTAAGAAGTSNFVLLSDELQQKLLDGNNGGLTIKGNMLCNDRVADVTVNNNPGRATTSFPCVNVLTAAPGQTVTALPDGGFEVTLAGKRTVIAQADKAGYSVNLKPDGQTLSIKDESNKDNIKNVATVDSSVRSISFLKPTGFEGLGQLTIQLKTDYCDAKIATPGKQEFVFTGSTITLDDGMKADVTVEGVSTNFAAKGAGGTITIGKGYVQGAGELLVAGMQGDRKYLAKPIDGRIKFLRVMTPSPEADAIQKQMASTRENGVVVTDSLMTFHNAVEVSTSRPQPGSKTATPEEREKLILEKTTGLWQSFVRAMDKSDEVIYRGNYGITNTWDGDKLTLLQGHSEQDMLDAARGKLLDKYNKADELLRWRQDLVDRLKITTELKHEIRSVVGDLDTYNKDAAAMALQDDAAIEKIMRKAGVPKEEYDTYREQTRNLIVKGALPLLQDDKDATMIALKADEQRTKEARKGAKDSLSGAKKELNAFGVHDLSELEGKVQSDADVYKIAQKTKLNTEDGGDLLVMHDGIGYQAKQVERLADKQGKPVQYDVSVGTFTFVRSPTTDDMLARVGQVNGKTPDARDVEWAYAQAVRQNSEDHPVQFAMPDGTSKTVTKEGIGGGKSTAAFKYDAAVMVGDTGDGMSVRLLTDMSEMARESAGRFGDYAKKLLGTPLEIARADIKNDGNIVIHGADIVGQKQYIDQNREQVNWLVRLFLGPHVYDEVSREVVGQMIYSPVEDSLKTGVFSSLTKTGLPADFVGKVSAMRQAFAETATKEERSNLNGFTIAITPPAVTQTQPAPLEQGVDESTEAYFKRVQDEAIKNVKTTKPATATFTLSMGKDRVHPSNTKSFTMDIPLEPDPPKPLPFSDTGTPTQDLNYAKAQLTDARQGAEELRHYTSILPPDQQAEANAHLDKIVAQTTNFYTLFDQLKQKQDALDTKDKMGKDQEADATAARQEGLRRMGQGVTDIVNIINDPRNKQLLTPNEQDKVQKAVDDLVAYQTNTLTGIGIAEAAGGALQGAGSSMEAAARQALGIFERLGGVPTTPSVAGGPQGGTGTTGTGGTTGSGQGLPPEFMANIETQLKSKMMAAIMPYGDHLKTSLTPEFAQAVMPLLQLQYSQGLQYTKVGIPQLQEWLKRVNNGKEPTPEQIVSKMRKVKK